MAGPPLHSFNSAGCLNRLNYPPKGEIYLYYNNRMIELNIPGRGVLQLDHLVCDVNGTLAVDGSLIDGVHPALNALRDRLTVHLLTADTYGRQTEIDQQLQLTAVRVHPGSEDEQKAAYVRSLGADHVAAVGQGANDALMLKEAALGICVLYPEGLAIETARCCDLVVPDILTALNLLAKPQRIVASLRK
jgi:P-type E1-E2 ATPase